MVEQANQVTIHLESLYESLDEEVRAPIRPSVEEPPNLELKPLPETLKYAYLGKDEKFQPEQKPRRIPLVRIEGE